jgi:hypothetical protein
MNWKISQSPAPGEALNTNSANDANESPVAHPNDSERAHSLLSTLSRDTSDF